MHRIFCKQQEIDRKGKSCFLMLNDFFSFCSYQAKYISCYLTSDSLFLKGSVLSYYVGFPVGDESLDSPHQ